MLLSNILKCFEYYKLMYTEPASESNAQPGVLLVQIRPNSYGRINDKHIRMNKRFKFLRLLLGLLDAGNARH
jgi:hypothetical protein